MARDGVAAKFWSKVERIRVDLGWTKERLSAETAKHTADGKVIPRSTLDNLRTSTRAPQARIVDAIADSIGLDRDEARVLAGVLPPPTDGTVSTRDAAAADPFWDEDERALILGLIDTATAAHHARRRHDPSGRATSTEQAI